MISMYVLVLSVALTVSVITLTMYVWHTRKSKQLRESLEDREMRIQHLNEIVTDRNNQNFDCYNRLNRELDKVHQLQEQVAVLTQELHDTKQKEAQDCGCTSHVFKYKWDSSIGGHNLFCTTHNSYDCVSAVSAQCVKCHSCKVSNN